MCAVQTTAMQKIRGINPADPTKKSKRNLEDETTVGAASVQLTSFYKPTVS